MATWRKLDSENYYCHLVPANKSKNRAVISVHIPSDESGDEGCWVISESTEETGWKESVVTWGFGKGMDDLASDSLKKARKMGYYVPA